MRAIAFALSVMLLAGRGTVAWAQGTLRLEVDPVSTAPGQPVQATVTVEGARGDGDLDLWVPPELHAARAGSSRNVQIINGVVESNYKFLFQIVGDTPGTYTVGPARLEQGHDALASNMVTLTIEKPAALPEDRTGVFLEAEVDNPAPYVGEQLTYTVRLFHPRNDRLVNFKLASPDTDGLWEEEQDTQTKAARVLNGQPYVVYTITKAFFPTRAGPAHIGPTTISYEEILPMRRQQRRSIFDDRFFGFPGGRSVQRGVESDPVVLDVRPLPAPPAGVAADGAAVGTFSMEAAAEATTVRVGESVTLTLTVRGEGNVRGVPDLVIPEAEAFKAYPDVAEVQVAAHGGTVAGVRTQRVAFVPQRAGTLIIPPITLPVFDPRSERWNVLRTEPFDIQVEPGEEQEPVVIAAAPSVAAPSPAHRLASDLLAPHPLPATLRAPGTRDRVVATGTTLGAPLLFVASWLARRRRDAHAADPTLQRRRRAAKTARAALRQAPPPTPDGVAGILSTYVADRVGAPSGSITGEETIALIKDASTALAEDAAGLIRAGEAARYGGGAAGTAASTDAALALIDALERLDLQRNAAHA